MFSTLREMRAFFGSAQLPLVFIPFSTKLCAEALIAARRERDAFHEAALPSRLHDDAHHAVDESKNSRYAEYTGESAAYRMMKRLA